MTALIVIGCVVLYLAAGYAVAFFYGKINGKYDDELVGLCSAFWPVVLFGAIVWLLTIGIPNKIISKTKKKE